MEVGFVGLGNMGIPMASRLLAAGFSVVGSDANPEACARAEQKGMKIVASPKDLADSVETIFLSLPTPAIVKAVCLGDNGIIFGGKVRRVVDMSTTGSATAIEVGQALKANGIQLIDCPVSGGVSGAVNGTLAVMVSCPVADYEFLQPALKQIGKLFFIGEEPGLAHVMKLVNNYLSATALAATSEAMAIATKAGIDPAVAIDVINAGSGRNSASQDKFPRSVSSRIGVDELGRDLTSPIRSCLALSALASPLASCSRISSCVSKKLKDWTWICRCKRR